MANKSRATATAQGYIITEMQSGEIIDILQRARKHLSKGRVSIAAVLLKQAEDKVTVFTKGGYRG